MKNKTFYLAIMIAMSLFSFVGCNNNDDDEPIDPFNKHKWLDEVRNETKALVDKKYAENKNDYYVARIKQYSFKGENHFEVFYAGIPPQLDLITKRPDIDMKIYDSKGNICFGVDSVDGVDTLYFLKEGYENFHEKATSIETLWEYEKGQAESNR